MSNRSSARNLFPPLDNPKLTIQRRSRADPTLLNDFEMAAKGNGDPPVPDLLTMEELCQPSLNGRGAPIALIAIQATNFGLKIDMIQQVQNSFQFHGLLEIMALKAKMAEINKNLMRVLQVNQQVKAVTPSCETCGGPHLYNDCPATVGQTHNVYSAGAYQGGNILLLEAFLNDDSSLPPPNQGMYLPQVQKELKICEAKNDKSSIDKPPEVELKDLPPHLEYAFLEGDDKLPIIIAKDLSVEEKAALIKEKSHFMVKEGIILGYKISKNRIEVNKAKVDVIAKLPHPTTIKEFDVIIRDKNGAKNLMADHLSRLENPHQDEIEKKEITKTFPLKTLGMIAFHGDSSTSWFTDFANYHAGNFIVKGMSSQQKKIL
nr:reverse transcriptase domain-containing protein [Tanacetum cinerariifolium]